jgi:RimJ/RimL family protein N-acetyltransferase
MPRVMAQVEPENERSRHVLEKLGMTQRGVRLTYGRPHLVYGVDREASASG